MTRQEKWDRRFLDLAKLVAGWSKDPSTQVGAVIVDPFGRVVSMGYNGFPRGVDDSPKRLNDRDLKYPIIIHAERNALLFAHRDLHGCRLYSWPVMPCVACTSMIIQVGITEVVSPVSDNPRWGHWPLVVELFQEAGVQFRQLQLLP